MGSKPSVTLRTHVGEVKLLWQPNLGSGVDSDTRDDATPHDDRPVSIDLLAGACFTERQLVEDPLRPFLSLATRRLSHTLLPSRATLPAPVALEDSPEARAWRTLPPSDDAREQWRVFLQRDDERHQALSPTFRSPAATTVEAVSPPSQTLRLASLGGAPGPPSSASVTTLV